MLYAGRSLEKAREIFTEAFHHRSRIRLTHSAANPDAGPVAEAVAARRMMRCRTTLLL